MDHYKKNLAKSIINRVLLFIIISTALLIGCAPTPTFIKPDFDQKQIKVIAVMPVIDERNLADDTTAAIKTLTMIEELISNKISEKNYDVVSASTIKKLMNDKAINNLTPQFLCTELNADGILFSELYKYADEFYVDHSLKMHFSIYDAKGDSIWVNDLNDSDKPFLSALGASLGWSIGVAVDNKISSKNKLPIILGGVAAAQLVYTIVDAVCDETSQSIDNVFKSLPDAKRSIR